MFTRLSRVVALVSLLAFGVASAAEPSPDRQKVFAELCAKYRESQLSKLEAQLTEAEAAHQSAKLGVVAKGTAAKAAKSKGKEVFESSRDKQSAIAKAEQAIALAEKRVSEIKSIEQSVPVLSISQMKKGDIGKLERQSMRVRSIRGKTSMIVGWGEWPDIIVWSSTEGGTSSSVVELPFVYEVTGTSTVDAVDAQTGREFTQTMFVLKPFFSEDGKKELNWRTVSDAPPARGSPALKRGTQAGEQAINRATSGK